MNSKNSIIKNDINSQNDNEVINNFSNINNIKENKKRQRKKINNYDNNTESTNNTTETRGVGNNDIPNLLDQHNYNIKMKDLKHKNYLSNKNNNTNISFMQDKDIIVELKKEKENINEEDIDNVDDFDLENTKEEDEIFKKKYEKVIKLMMENTDVLEIIRNFNVFDESKIKCFEDILNLNKKRNRSTNNKTIGKKSNKKNRRRK